MKRQAFTDGADWMKSDHQVFKEACSGCVAREITALRNADLIK